MSGNEGNIMNISGINNSGGINNDTSLLTTSASANTTATTTTSLQQQQSLLYSEGIDDSGGGIGLRNTLYKMDVLKELEDISNMTIYQTGFFCK